MKEIIFHPHALYKMRKRGIAADFVLEVLDRPDLVQKGKYGRRIAQKLKGSYLL